MTIRGVVVDFDTGDPIANTHVYVERLNPGRDADGLVRLDTRHLEATTDTAGRFRIGGLAPMPAQLVADPPKDEPYFVGEHIVQLNAYDKEAETKIQLKRGIWIEGWVDRQSIRQTRQVKC